MMKKLLSALIVFTTIMSLFSVNCVAAETVKIVDSVMYKVNPDGSLGEKYTGFTKTSAGEQYYRKEGVRLTGVQVFPHNEIYVFDDRGVYVSKRVLNGELSIIFDNNCNIKISDGKIFFR